MELDHCPTLNEDPVTSSRVNIDSISHKAAVYLPTLPSYIEKIVVRKIMSLGSHCLMPQLQMLYRKLRVSNREMKARYESSLFGCIKISLGISPVA